MAKYKAIKRGFDGIKVREAGETFEFSGKPGKWMEALAVLKPEVKVEEKSEEKPKANPKPEGK